MKTTLKLFTFLMVVFSFLACSDDDGDAVSEFTVTTISPESGTVGTEIRITGTDFPSDASNISVSFNGIPATVTSVSTTEIVTTVPSGATSGQIEISANGFRKTSAATFTVLSNLVSDTVSNLEAPQTGGQGQPIGGPFTKFSFETGAVTDSETDWDIAFRGTTIAVNGGTATGTNEEPTRNGNGGATVQNGIFSDITSADGLSFDQDAAGSFAVPAGSGEGWYNYNPATFTVTPIPGRILVFRTHDGKFAKVEIISYYRDAPAEPDAFLNESRVYTFNYVYNPNEGETALE
ncbi:MULTISPECIES: IPT/TIG domain-containing protein [Maribacter]|uniref:IPT/TIG domain-containing protein n=1 Tax=Maribacter flavus TaxID=1658664 RepID=A0ABU7IHW4_9FLAO|nr:MULTISPECIES: IPT/TIG domain-containing protein [Maribacter]MDC6405116.1 IPT/TIG domain-containing protein [Maribacter sp. PR66]MEE1972529.1 IPT/TIG domain-containing protein [Maribacter flavus]